MLKPASRPIAAGMLLAVLWFAVTTVQAQQSGSDDVAPAGTVARGQPLEDISNRDERGTYPRVKGAIDIEIQNDRSFNARGGADERNVLFTDSEASLGIYLNPTVSLQATFHFEPVRDRPGDRIFDDHGLYLQQLYLLYDDQRISGFAGKFDADFGFAWDKASGIYGSDFAEDYEFNEKLGFGGAYTIDAGEYGKHKIGLKLFLADNTPLSYTAFERRFPDTDGRLRRRNRESYPGVGNTGWPRSFTVTVGAEEIAAIAAMSYNVGVIHERGDNGAENETGAVAGFQLKFRPVENLEIIPLIEGAYIDNYQGERDRRLYLTVGLGAAYQGWSASASTTYRDIRRPVGSDPGNTQDKLYQATVGYSFDFGIGLHVGWKREKIESERVDTLGALVTYNYSF